MGNVIPLIWESCSSEVYVYFSLPLLTEELLASFLSAMTFSWYFCWSHLLSHVFHGHHRVSLQAVAILSGETVVLRSHTVWVSLSGTIKRNGEALQGESKTDAVMCWRVRKLMASILYWALGDKVLNFSMVSSKYLKTVFPASVSVTRLSSVQIMMSHLFLRWSTPHRTS